MKKLLFALALVGASFTSTLEAKENKLLDFDNLVKINLQVEDYLCTVISETYNIYRGMDEEGNFIVTRVTITTFTPCEQQ